MKRDIKGAWSKATREQYGSQWRRFKKFAKRVLRTDPMSVGQDGMAIYVVHLHNGNIRAGGIRSHLAALSQKFKLADLETPTESFAIKKLLAAYAKTDPPVGIRKPLDRKNVIKIVSKLGQVAKSKYEKKMLTALFTLMYRALLRVSEVTKSKKNKHNITKQQVNVREKQTKEVQVQFITYKHSKAPCSIAVPAAETACAWKACRQYQVVAKQATSYFTHSSGEPLTVSYVRKTLNKVLKLVGLNPTEYNTHSFRIGRATDMFKQGYTDAQICMAGRWNSKAYKKYIKPQILRFD
jgi:site-specific recombinase XerD